MKYIFKTLLFLILGILYIPIIMLLLFFSLFELFACRDPYDIMFCKFVDYMHLIRNKIEEL